MQSDLDPPKTFSILPRNTGSTYLDFGSMEPPLGMDFSGWIERNFPWAFQQPGVVIGPKGIKKGSPVPAPGNVGPGGSARGPENPITLENMPGWLQFLWPSKGQQRDIAVYGLALIVFVIAFAAILK